MSRQPEDSRPLSQYDVFISYSRDDGRLAASIQRGLQRIAHPWYKRAIIRVVRDVTTMSTGPDLRQAVLGYLDDSRNLIVIGSPSAARSPWVNREISHWRGTSHSGRILPILAAGEWRFPPALEEGGDDVEPDAAAPPSLRGAADEPRYTDVRWAQDDQHLSLRNTKFRDAIGELAAGVLGTSKDRIVGEEIRVRRRNTRWVAAAAIVLVLALASTAVAFVRSAGSSETARSERLASQAIELGAQHSDASPLLAAEAIAIRPTPEAVSAGLQLLYERGPMLGFVDGVARLGSIAFASGGTALIERDGYLSTLDPHSLDTGPPVPVKGTTSVLAASSDGAKAVLQDSTGVRLVDRQTGAVTSVDIDADDTVNAAILSADGDHLLLGLGSGVVERRNAQNGSVEHTTTLTGFQPDMSVVSFAENGRALAVRSGNDDHVAYYHISASGVVGSPITFGASLGLKGVYEIGISPGGRYVAGAVTPDGRGATVKVIDTRAKPERRFVTALDFSGTINSLDLAESGTGPIIATGVQNGGAYVWTSVNTVPQSVLTDTAIDGVALSPDASTLVTSGDGRVAVSDLKRAPLDRTVPEDASVTGTPFDMLQDGNVTYVLRRGSLTAYQNGNRPRVLPLDQTKPPGVLVQSNTGIELMTIVDGGLRAYSVKNRAWRHVATDNHSDGQWQALRTTSDHRYLVAKSTHRLALLNPTTGKERFSVGPGDATDGVPAYGDLDTGRGRFAWWSTEGGGVSIVQLDTGRSTRIEVPSTSVRDAVFLPDGRLAVASLSGLFVFDQLASSRSRESWELPHGRTPILLGTDGDYLAVLTELRDGQSQLLVYDDTSGRPALQLVPRLGIPMRLMTGRHLTAVSEETVEVEPVWRDSRQLVRMLCASVARTPRVAERERFPYGQRVEGCVVSIRGGGLIKGCPVTWARVGWSASRWCRRG
jgi:WD40 repeat protein